VRWGAILGRIAPPPPRPFSCHSCLILSYSAANSVGNKEGVVLRVLIKQRLLQFRYCRRHCEAPQRGRGWWLPPCPAF